MCVVLVMCGKWHRKWPLCREASQLRSKVVKEEWKKTVGRLMRLQGSLKAREEGERGGILWCGLTGFRPPKLTGSSSWLSPDSVPGYSSKLLLDVIRLAASLERDRLKVK